MSHSDREREIPVPSALARACADSPCSASRRWLPSIAQAISELRPPTGGLPPTAAASDRRRRSLYTLVPFQLFAPSSPSPNELFGSRPSRSCDWSRKVGAALAVLGAHQPDEHARQ